MQESMRRPNIDLLRAPKARRLTCFTKLRLDVIPQRGPQDHLPIASRQCAMTPGHLDTIVRGRMISGGKPLEEAVV